MTTTVHPPADRNPSIGQDPPAPITAAPPQPTPARRDAGLGVRRRSGKGGRRRRPPGAGPPFAVGRVVLVALMLCLLLACGGEEGRGGAGEDTVADTSGAETGGPGGTPDTAGRPAPPAGAAGPGVDLPNLLSRAAERDQQGRLRLLDRMRPPETTSTRAVPNRHDPARTDTVRTLGWEGIELEVYHVSASGREILRSVRVTDERYAAEGGLRAGLTRERVRALRGEPERTEDGAWIYEVYEGEQDPTPTLLRVSFEGERVSALEWEFYVD